MSGCKPSWSGRSKASDPTCGSTPPTKVRQAGCVVAMAVTVAVGVNTDGRKEAGDGDRLLRGRDLLDGVPAQAGPSRPARVKLVVSDAHEGLKAAAARVLSAAHQRCRVRFARNALAHALQERSARGFSADGRRLRPGRRAGLHELPGRAPRWLASSPTRPRSPGSSGAILLEQSDEWAVQRSR